MPAGSAVGIGTHECACFVSSGAQEERICQQIGLLWRVTAVVPFDHNSLAGLESRASRGARELGCCACVRYDSGHRGKGEQQSCHCEMWRSERLVRKSDGHCSVQWEIDEWGVCMS
jgi:hypothetical protein